MHQIEIRVAVLGDADEMKHSAKVSSLVGSLIEEALRQDQQLDATAVSPLTGEPVHLVSDKSVLSQISSITVSSPTGTYNALVRGLNESLDMQGCESTVVYVDEEA